MGAAASARMGCSLYIIKVSPGSPAQAAGLLPFFHYIIGINGEPVVSEADIQRISTSWASGALQVLILDSRNGDSWNVNLTRQADEKIGFSVKLHKGPMNLVSFKVLDLDYNSPGLEARLQKDQDYIIAHEHGPFSNMNEFESIMYRNRGTPVILWVYNIGTCEVRQVTIIPDEEGKIGCSLGTGIKNELPYIDGGIDLVQVSDNILEPVPASATTTANPNTATAEDPKPTEGLTVIQNTTPTESLTATANATDPIQDPIPDTLATLPGAVIESESSKETVEAPGNTSSVFETGTSAPPGHLVLPQTEYTHGLDSSHSDRYNNGHIQQDNTTDIIEHANEHVNEQEDEHLNEHIEHDEHVNEQDNNMEIIEHTNEHAEHDEQDTGVTEHDEHNEQPEYLHSNLLSITNPLAITNPQVSTTGHNMDSVSCGRPVSHPSANNPNFFLSDNPDEKVVIEQKEASTHVPTPAVTAESDEEDTSALFRDHYVPFLLDVEGHPGEVRKQEGSRDSFQTDYVGHKEHYPK